MSNDTTNKSNPMSSKNNNNNRNPKNHRKKYPQRRRPPPETAPTTTTSSTSTTNMEEKEEENEDTATCLICYGELKHVGLVKCGHDDICGMCHLRLRFLHDDLLCPVCKTSNEHVIVISNTSSRTAKFEDYPVWNDNDIGPQFTFDKNMFFQHAYYKEQVKPLFSLSCTACPDFTNQEDTYICQEVPTAAGKKASSNKNQKKKRLTALDALQQHLRAQHSPSLSLCILCVEHKVDFISRLPYRTAGQLKQHNNDKKRGHPICQFCAPKRFFDLQALHTHLNKEHYKCHICEQQNLSDQFYKSYTSLQRHFEKSHFPCPHPNCVEARFVVFSNELDLQAHLRTIHNDHSTYGKNTKINLEFRIRRSTDIEQPNNNNNNNDSGNSNYNIDGQVFVPDSLSRQQQENEPVITHAAHAQRTAELRQEAQRIRSNQEQAQAFPSLSTNTNTTTAGLVGWNSNMVRANQSSRMSRENFPSLPTTNSSTTRTNIKTPMRNVPTNSLASMRLGHRPQYPSSSSSTTSWSSSKPPSSLTSNSVTSTATTVPRSNTTIASRVATSTMNNRSNLAANNFPSLPTTTKATIATNKKTTTQSLASKLLKQQQQPTPPTTKLASWGANTKTSETRNSTKNLTLSNFPTLPAKTKKSSTKKSLNVNQDYAAAEAFFSKQQQLNTNKMNNHSELVRTSVAKGALSSTMAMPSSSIVTQQQDNRKMAAKSKPTNKQIASTKDNKHYPSLTTPASGKELVTEMKSTMGPTKYKQLKKWTQQLAQQNINGQFYIDNACTLFDDGILDDLFWNYIPPLLQSCPSHTAQQALSYMENLRFAQVLQQREYSSHRTIA